MTVFADTPTLGLLIGIPVVVISLLCCVGLFFFARSESDWLWGVVWGGGAALVVLIIAAYCYWPFKHDYHFWIEKGGVVQEKAKRLVPAGDSGMQEKIVLRIDGRPYGITDTRAALVKVGQSVDIACKKAFEWGVPEEAHGWDCKWRGVAR